MKKPAFLIALLLTTALTVSGAVLQGRYSGRWAPVTELTAAGARLAEVPDHCGAWRVLATTKWDPGQVKTLACAGYIQRTYEHQRTAQTVEVAVLVGPPGPTAVHTPEICYSSRAYDIDGRTERLIVPRADGGTDEFWGTVFRSLTPGVGPLLVAYGYSDGQNWLAPEHPRIALGDGRFLYKLQLAISLPPESSLGKVDPRTAFLSDFLPTLAPVLAK